MQVCFGEMNYKKLNSLNEVWHSAFKQFFNRLPSLLLSVQLFAVNWWWWVRSMRWYQIATIFDSDQDNWTVKLGVIIFKPVGKNPLFCLLSSHVTPHESCQQLNKNHIFVGRGRRSQCERPPLGKPSPTREPFNLIALLEGILLSGALELCSAPLLQVTESGGGVASLIRCEWHNGGAQSKPACVFPSFKATLLRPSMAHGWLPALKASLSFPPLYVAHWRCESWKGAVTCRSRRVKLNARFPSVHWDGCHVEGRAGPWIPAAPWCTHWGKKKNGR